MTSFSQSRVITRPNLTTPNKRNACVEKDLKKEIEKTVVRLTQYEYEKMFLKYISHQRPVPTKQPESVEINSKTFYVLTFDRSYNQIRNYFLRLEPMQRLFLHIT